MAIKFSSFDIEALSSELGSTNVAANLVEMAKCAEGAERYEDMCCFMHKRVSDFPDSPLNVEERNYLSVAYKNVIGARRASWRAITGELEATDDPTNGPFSAYKKQIEEELENISQDVLKLLESYLIPKVPADKHEETVFYLKMAGDYYRYLTESVDKKDYKKKTEELYEKAFGVAKEQLPATHPIRLGLALNYSVCKYEILKAPTNACEMAKTAFDNAIAELDSLPEEDYKDSTLIMQLLRDNLTLWTSTEEPTVEDLED
jgi:hypothetical protein